jgi:hypothetical protein
MFPSHILIYYVIIEIYYTIRSNKLHCDWAEFMLLLVPFFRVGFSPSLYSSLSSFLLCKKELIYRNFGRLQCLHTFRMYFSATGLSIKLMIISFPV